VQPLSLLPLPLLLLSLPPLLSTLLPRLLELLHRQLPMPSRLPLPSSAPPQCLLWAPSNRLLRLVHLQARMLLPSLPMPPALLRVLWLQRLPPPLLLLLPPLLLLLLPRYQPLPLLLPCPHPPLALPLRLLLPHLLPRLLLSRHRTRLPMSSHPQHPPLASLLLPPSQLRHPLLQWPPRLRPPLRLPSLLDLHRQQLLLLRPPASPHLPLAWLP
jgi:hypothetical protein